MVELIVRDHVLSKFVVKIIPICLFFKLNPVRLLNFKAKLFGSFLEIWKDIICQVVILSLVH